jgi:hypothetical protein
MADSSTGSGTINSPVLQHWFPEMESDGAQRVLVSLEKEGFIFREQPQSQKRAYRYFVNKYEATTGPNRLRLSDLSQVFETKNVNDIKWTKPATEGATDPATQGATEGATDPANSNKKEETKKPRNQKSEKVSTKTPIGVPIGVSLCVPEVPEDSGEDARASQYVSDAVSHSVSQSVSHSLSQSVASIDGPNKCPPLTFEYGDSPGWKDKRTARPLDFGEVNSHLSTLGYEYKNNEIFRDGVLVPFKQAVKEIEGATK